VRSNTESPCPRSAEVEILGVPFCGPCARQQEAYFAIGELTRGSRVSAASRSPRRFPGCEGSESPRVASSRSRGIRSAIDESVEEIKSASRPVGLDVSTFSAAE
jgi:hypothetical protein